MWTWTLALLFFVIFLYESGYSGSKISMNSSFSLIFASPSLDNVIQKFI